ncbi:class II aldolase/adducin family protein [Pseudomonas agarici]
MLSSVDFGELNYGLNKAGAVIHSAIHHTRDDVGCVIHTHSWAAMAVSSQDCGLLPISQTAMRFLKMGYHDYQGVVFDIVEQSAVIEELGQGYEEVEVAGHRL